MNFRNTLLLIFGTFCILGIPNKVIAQQKPPKPPRPMSVSSVQSLNFGTISVGNDGGTVTIDQFGGRTASGQVFPLGSATSPATFYIDVEPGTPISLATTFDTSLSDGNGHSITLHIEDNIFIATGVQKTLLSIGGTLTIGAATPPGNYVGSFFITFVQE